MARQSTHDTRVKEILKDPESILGLENIIYSSTEVQLWKKKNLVYVADLMFIENPAGLWTPRWVIVEYKCNNSIRNREKAINQLTRAYDWWTAYIKETPDLIYAWGQYEIEPIIPKNN